MTTAPAPPARPARFRPRYSLRLLLIAFTAFAIGFPIWYRWPYEESLEEATTSPTDPFASPRPKPAKLNRSVVTTWQRQWGGGRKKHGPERTFVNGTLVTLETFDSDQRHGPCEYYNSLGREVGQFVQGKKDGTWTRFDRDGGVRRTMRWHENLMDGPYDRAFEDGTRSSFLFAAGRLLEANGAPVDDRLNKLLAENRIDSPRTRRELESLTDIEFVETPLRDGVEFISEKHEVRVTLDPHHAKFDRPVTAELRGIRLASALTMIAAITDHRCDYRYGCIWITSPDDAKDWCDPTGVAEIRPSPDSQLGKAWDEPVDLEVIQVPLALAFGQSSERLAIQFDFTALEASTSDGVTFAVTERIKGHPFRHALGILLYQAHCRCELRGETLVILPSE